MIFFKRNKYNFLLFGFVALVFFVNAYNLTINSKPTYLHQWRQSDCLSIAKNFYEEGNSLFEPKIHWQYPTDGHAAGELPLINYTVAQLWKVFGQSEGLYRVFNYFIFVGSIFMLFNTLNFFKKPVLLQFFCVSIVITSPLITCYAFNFLSDVPALSLSIISFCVFFRFYYSGKRHLFFISLIIATLAVLLKASSLGAWMIISIVSLLVIYKPTFLLQAESPFKNRIFPVLSIFLSLLPIWLWYTYAKNYNAENKSSVFLTGILPLWELDGKEITKVTSNLFTEHLATFLNRPMLFLFFLALIYVLANYKKLNAFLKISFVVSGGFSVLFLVLFFKVFDVHDYYLINLMFFPVVVMFCFFSLLPDSFSLVGRKWVVVAMFFCIFFNSLYSAAFYRLRSIKNDRLCSWYPFISDQEKENYDYDLKKFNRRMDPLLKLTPVLRGMGITRNDLVMSAPDISPNSTLYLMDQKGYTVTEEAMKKDTLWINPGRFNECSYFIVNDTAIKSSISFKILEPRLDFKFNLDGVEIYKIRKR